MHSMPRARPILFLVQCWSVGGCARALVLSTALSLSFSSQFAPPTEGKWTVQGLSWWVARPMPVAVLREQPNSVAPEAPTTIAARVSSPASEAASVITPQIAESEPVSRMAEVPAIAPSGTLFALPPRDAASSSLPASEAACDVLPGQIADSKPASRMPEPGPVELVAIVQGPLPDPETMDEVDGYLWEVYQRAPTKRDASGDFTWKDPVAATRFGLSMATYVIVGMHPDFREQLYHAGRAMDAAGIRWSILSGFRDDYRQSIASGFRASVGKSMHGGTARTGGYGHGQAVDIASEDGDAKLVWQWIDRHGAKFGLYRPMGGIDPAHVQPRGSWRDLALALRNARLGMAEEAQARGIMTAHADDFAEPHLDKVASP